MGPVDGVSNPREPIASYTGEGVIDAGGNSTKSANVAKPAALNLAPAKSKKHLKRKLLSDEKLSEVILNAAVNDLLDQREQMEAYTRRNLQKKKSINTKSARNDTKLDLKKLKHDESADIIHDDGSSNPPHFHVKSRLDDAKSKRDVKIKPWSNVKKEEKHPSVKQNPSKRRLRKNNDIDSELFKHGVVAENEPRSKRNRRLMSRYKSH